MTQNLPLITFLIVKDNQTKLKSICKIAQKHFEKKQPILILAPSEEIAEYIDQLLWRIPEESFLPHQKSDLSSNDFITISTKMENLNRARIAFNLYSSICPLHQEFDQIYELYDETHPSKKEQSLQRKNAYASIVKNIEFIETSKF